MLAATPTTTRIDDATNRLDGRRRLIEATREAATWHKPKRRAKRRPATTD